MSQDIDSLRVFTRIFLFAEGGTGHPAVGRGVIKLLTCLQETGSLNKAAKELGMAYSRAWLLIGAIEEALDIKLLLRDGARGSSLTKEGQQIIQLYHEVTEKTDAFAQKALAEGLESIKNNHG